jgi:hypothetical protein
MKKFVHWLNKNVEVVESLLFQLRKENIELNNEYNKLIKKKARFEVEYQKMKKRVNKFEEEEFESLKMFIKSVRNTSNSIVISDLIIWKKLLDSSIFIDEKNSNIEDWLLIMKNKLKNNANWFSIETGKKVYVRIQTDENVMKYLFARFKKNSIKSFLTAEEIFDDLNRVFDDVNKKINALKTYKRLISYFLSWISTFDKRFEILWWEDFFKRFER